MVEEILTLQKNKDENTWNQNLFLMNKLRRKGLITWMNKNKIYCMLILHQNKLMTSNGICILLILLEKD